MPQKTALILSGGGAKGAFQCAVEKYAREVKGYKWDLIAGVSVGALNGSMIAMQKSPRLFEIWNTLSNDKIYTGGFNVFSTLKLLFGSKSFFENKPLQRLMAQELDVNQIQADLRIGAVSLTTGEYLIFKPHQPEFYDAVLASTVIPVIWTPIDISDQYQQMVDGGVRNISPIGDVLDEEPDEVVIINCTPQDTPPLTNPLKNVVQIGLRTIDLMMNEIFINDVNEFIRINALVKQASEHGISLHNPKNGREYRHFNYKLVEPKEPLGDTLDFSQGSIQKSIAEGFKRAREIFGR
jgi:NTE family protein